MCLSSRFSDDADALGPESTAWELLVQMKLIQAGKTPGYDGGEPGAGSCTGLQVCCGWLQQPIGPEGSLDGKL